jgi:hypothetical protein
MVPQIILLGRFELAEIQFLNFHFKKYFTGGQTRVARFFLVQHTKT